MGAPEKIYVTPVRTWDTKHIPDLSDNIYISKDFLMEWIKANLQDRDNWNEKSAADAFWETIDKVNSM